MQKSGYCKEVWVQLLSKRWSYSLYI